VHDFPLRWPGETVVRVKTGNGTVNGEQVSWLVGALETGGRQFVFASRATGKAGTLGTTSGADLALRVLNAPAFAPAALRRGEPAFATAAPRRGERRIYGQYDEARHSP
jgi:hypothetical protein